MIKYPKNTKGFQFSQIRYRSGREIKANEITVRGHKLRSKSSFLVPFRQGMVGMLRVKKLYGTFRKIRPLFVVISAYSPTAAVDINRQR